MRAPTARQHAESEEDQGSRLTDGAAAESASVTAVGGFDAEAETVMLDMPIIPARLRQKPAEADKDGRRR